MTFLAPIAGILAAGIGAPILIAMYFLKLRRRPLRVSSTLLWDRATADLQVNVPFRMIRPSWLLALQLLLLALLAAALARPALEGQSAPSGRIAIVIDHSASMSALDATDAKSTTPLSRLDQAKQRALEYVRRMGAGAQAIVIPFAARAQATTTLTANRALLRRAIEAIEPTDQQGNLRTALRVAGAALGGTAEDADSPGRVVLFSDGGEDTTQGAGPTGLGRSTINFIRIGPPEKQDKDNIGIVALSATRDYQDPVKVRLFLRIQSIVPRVVDTAITVRFNTVPILSQRLKLPAHRLGAAPTSASHTFEFDEPGGGLINVSITHFDALASDNTSAIVLRAPASPRLALVQPNTQRRVIDLLTEDVLSSLNPRSLTTLTAGEYETAAQANAITGNFDLIVFDRVKPQQLPTVPTISFGAGLPIPGLGLSQPAGNVQPTDIAFWKRTHPIMRYVTMANVQIRKPGRLTLPKPGAFTGTTTELATGRDGTLIGLIESDGIRRIVVAFELGASQWWQQPSFPVFMKNAVDYLTLAGDEEVALTTDQSLTIKTEPTARELIASGPLSFTKSVTGGTAVKIGPLPRAGVYEFQGATAPDHVKAVNLLSPRESALTTRDNIPIGARDVTTTTLGMAAAREIWQWFVLAAAVLLAFEWLAYAWRMRG